MKCHKCGAKLKVVRTITVESGGKTQEAVCSGCEGRYTCITFIWKEVTGYGTGAEAAATRLRKGDLGLEGRNGQ